MACEKVPVNNVKAALARLEAALDSGTVKVKVGPQGAVVFLGWENRDGMTDGCALRKLQTQGSPALRMALAKAEAMAGRPMSRAVVNAGVHSHDGGKTWGRHS